MKKVLIKHPIQHDGVLWRRGEYFLGDEPGQIPEAIAKLFLDNCPYAVKRCEVQQNA